MKKILDKISNLKYYQKAALLYTFVTLVFFYPVFQNKLPIYIDNLLHIGPMYHFFRESILAGHLPLWNPLILQGLPFFADPSHPVFTPFNVFFLLIPNVYQAITVQIMLLIIAASLGMFYLAKQINLSTKASILAGIFFGFSGSMMENVHDLNSLIGITCIPFIVSMFIREIIRKDSFFSWKLSVLIAFQILSSHSQYVYYSLLMIGVVVAYSMLFKKSKNSLLIYIFQFICTILFALSLSAIQLIPTLELLQNTQRQNNITQDLAGIPMLATPRLLFPQIYGALNQGASWGPGSTLETGLANVNGFLSISALGFALLAICFNHKKIITIMLSVVAVVTLLLSFGDNLFVYDFFYKYLPGFNFFRSPQRILILYTIAISLLAGIGYDSIKQKNFISKKELSILLGTSITFLIIVLELWVMNPNTLFNIILNIYELIKGSPISESSAYSIEKIKAISELLLRSIEFFIIGIVGFFTIVKSQIWKQASVFNLGILILVLELFLSVRSNLIFINNDVLVPKIQIKQFFEEKDIPQYRIISTGDTQPYTGIWVYFNHFIAREPYAESSVSKDENLHWTRLNEELMMIPANIHQLYSLPSSAGYVAIMPKAYRDYWNSKKVNSIDFNNYQNELLSETSTKYFITGIPIDVIKDDKSDQFKQVFQHNEIKVYENTQAKPRVELLRNNLSISSDIKTDFSNPNKVQIDISATQSGKLVLRDYNYPGWYATVNDQKAAIEPYQELFRSVQIPSGDNKVVFEYRPKSLIFGSVISSLSVLLVFYFFYKDKMKHHKYKNYAK